jgi:CRP-like cAMP-binding protein
MDTSAIRSSSLFKGMSDEELETALHNLGAHERTFAKGETVLHAGNTTREMGIILAGSVTIENEDLWGNRTILNLAESGDFFAEVYAIFGNEPLLVNVRANEDCRILFLRLGGSLLEQTGGWQAKLVQNLLLISSRKNLVLSGRAFHTSPKTIRGRIMAYLDTMSRKKNSRRFDIPFDRQQMADYLNVERTALSKELGKMKNNGLIDYSRNHFAIL